jgi:hypothetical protein
VASGLRQHRCSRIEERGTLSGALIGSSPMTDGAAGVYERGYGSNSQGLHCAVPIRTGYQRLRVTHHMQRGQGDRAHRAEKGATRLGLSKLWKFRSRPRTRKIPQNQNLIGS